MEKDFQEKQLEVFKNFMDDVVSSYRQRKGFTKRSFKNFQKKDFEDFSNHIKDNMEGETEIKPSTIKSYRYMYIEKEGYPLRYSKRVMDYLAEYLSFLDFRAYVDNLKEKIGYKDYRTSMLIVYGKKEAKKAMSYSLFNTLNTTELNEYIQYYISKIKRYPKNDINYYWLGVLLLKINQYNLAIQHLKRSIEINPLEEEYYYNLALAEFRGRRPFCLQMEEIKNILRLLNMALDINSKKAKFYRLKSIINKDYFKRRGLSVPEKVVELQAVNRLNQDPIELKRLIELINIPYKSFTS